MRRPNHESSTVGERERERERERESKLIKIEGEVLEHSRLVSLFSDNSLLLLLLFLLLLLLLSINYCYYYFYNY